MVNNNQQCRLAAVTGADGFIGSHLVEALLDKGYRVRAMVQYNSFGSWGWLEGRQPSGMLEIVAGDVRDPDFCRTFCRGADVVFHLAALIAIPYSYEAPDSYVDTNIRGTLNILQAARDAACSRVVVTSTSEVYGSALHVPIKENHPRQPQSPYSATKIAADAMAKSFYNAFDMPVVIARPFNTYGPRQSARAFIPTVISQIAAGATRIRLGDLRPTRDFNYVTDTAAGFIALAEATGIEGMEINIATGTEISMGDTAAEIARLMNADIEIEEDPQRLRPANSEVTRLCGDSSLIRRLTGWEPAVSFSDGLKRTIDWLSDPGNLAKYKPMLYNR